MITSAKFGDIYLVNFEPGVGHEYKKTRPAIIIQEEKYFHKSHCVTIIPISSRLENRTPDDIFIQRDEATNKLTKDSIIKAFNIHGFDKSRFIHYIGKAGSPVIRQVRGYLRRHFGL